MKLIIISGRSGSGKSTALHVLEDLGYYCIDNLPAGLLVPLTDQALSQGTAQQKRIAVSIDARNLSSHLSEFPEIHARLQGKPLSYEVIFLDAQEETLLKRFHATRRKHPLTDPSVSLKEAIQAERALLEPILSLADIQIDTSRLTIYQLRDQIKHQIAGRTGQELALLFQSFGFKHGVPSDADFLFDVRCLPNPYWENGLRAHTGQEDCVIEFLEKQPDTNKMVKDITGLLENWLPRFQESNRTYMTICIGCTGGQHRSVYVTERLASHFSELCANVQVRHKELS